MLDRYDKKDDFRMYQDIVSPPSPGKVECCLLQLHHILISAVGPMFRTQLSCIGPVTYTYTHVALQDIMLFRISLNLEER